MMIGENGIGLGFEGIYPSIIKFISSLRGK